MARGFEGRRCHRLRRVDLLIAALRFVRFLNMRLWTVRNILPGMWLVACIVAVAAAPPELRSGDRVATGGGFLSPGTQLIPCAADWNGDGLADLLCGCQPAFKVAVYLNSGTAEEPAYSTSSYVQAGGADIYLPSSGCGSPAPWVGDYDHDGRVDLLVGSGSDGKVFFYRNTGATGATPVLAAGVALARDGGVLSVGSRATPFLHDWDEDGLEDLMCGDGNGRVHFFKNVGTAGVPVYRDDVLLMAGGVILDFGSRSAARVVDWDRDGRKDLVGSASNNVSWCRNVGSNAIPQLEAPVRLQAPVPGFGLANIDNGSRMRLEVVDWDRDGVLDVLVGSWDGWLWHYEGYRFACSRVTRPAPGTVELEWQSASHLNYRILAGASPEAVGSPIGTGIASEGNITTWSGPAGGARQFFRVEVE